MAATQALAALLYCIYGSTLQMQRESQWQWFKVRKRNMHSLLGQGIEQSTTIIAFVITKGVIVATDSRKTIPESKEIVTNKAKKILNCDQFFIGASGWAMDCRKCQKFIKAIVTFFSRRHGGVDDNTSY